MKILAALVGGCFSMAFYFATLELLDEILGLDVEATIRITVAILIFVGGFLVTAIGVAGGGKR